MKIFEQIQMTRPKKNSFDLSHERKISMNMGDLVPILCEEVIPGDSFRVNSEIFMRLAPMIAPVMHRCDVTTHYFFVPSRILWNEFENFITGGRNGTLTPTFPQIEINTTQKHYFKQGCLPDYFGIPPVKQSDNVLNKIFINQLPFRAYQKIYNEYYRDQNVSEPVHEHTDSGKLDTDTGGGYEELLTMRKRCWEKDYFTSALPWAQRGAPVGTDITMVPDYLVHSELRRFDGALPEEGNASINNGQLIDDFSDSIRVENLESIQTGTLLIEDLRKSVKLQTWLEKNARGGARYIEQILHHFGIKSSDARLQRPEYLGGGKQPIVISEVLNTTGPTANPDTSNWVAPQGNMAGHGISVGQSNRFSKSFEEHGYIIGLMSVLPRTAYQQGIEKSWLKTDKLEFYWPEFAQLGEQEIKATELMHRYETAPINPVPTFGYQMRYAEYRYRQSMVAGEMRDELDFWHMGRKFDLVPVLNTGFVEADPTHRIFAVEEEESHKLYCQIYNKVNALRPIPYFNVPSL